MVRRTVMRMIYVLTGAVAVAGALALFGVGSTSSSPSIAKEPASAAPKPVNAAPMNADPTASADDDEAPGSAMEALEGEALETLTVPGYTYIRIGQKGAEGEWVAVASAPVNVGDHVRFQGQTVMTDFTSSTLKRTFATIRFGALAGAGAGSAEGAANPHGASAMPAGHPPTNAPADGEVKVGDVAKAEGPSGLRIEELFAKKAGFAGKAARVRGVVVKATNGVMGKNFIHLRDGSGSDAQKNNDLTVTTLEAVEKGQTVVLEGTVTLDKDLGAGYRYDVLLEDAKSVK